MSTFVGPGEIIHRSESDRESLIITAGNGCYKDPKDELIIRSSVYGHINILKKASNENIVHVIPFSTSEPIIKVADIVICQVQKIFMSNITVEIITVGDKPLSKNAYPKGIIKREDTCAQSLDATIPMYNYFKPGDTVRAEVISLGDIRQYYLKTNSNDLGVIKAKSLQGNSLIVINEKVLYYEKCISFMKSITIIITSVYFVILH